MARDATTMTPSLVRTRNTERVESRLIFEDYWSVSRFESSNICNCSHHHYCSKCSSSFKTLERKINASLIYSKQGKQENREFKGYLRVSFNPHVIVHEFKKDD